MNIPDPRPRIIYGIFVDGICQYVGQTINPVTRAIPHRKKYPKMELRVLAKASAKIANAQETKFILRYKALGQAADNKETRGRRPNFFIYGTKEVVCLDTGETFDSLTCAAYVLNVTISTLREGLRNDGVFTVNGKRYMVESEAYNDGWNLGDHGSTPGDSVFRLHWNPLHRRQFELGWTEAERMKATA